MINETGFAEAIILLRPRIPHALPPVFCLKRSHANNFKRLK